ncbi:MAG TPA: IS200/IS605 family transposase [Terriglobia bacterium]|nr:IS200/IS605 family transposase [Terriglobia bacterium]
MAQTFSNLLTHVIFSTKDRFPLISSELRPDLLAFMGGIVRELNGKALTVGGTADHVHLLVNLPPTLAIADALRVVKANSSKWVHETKGRSKFAWQAGYGAFSVSQSNAASVIKYIAGQEEHHRGFTFQEELLTLLKKHGIPYDERYIWV